MKKIFGAAVLGTSGSGSSTRQGRPTIQTIGSFGKNKRRPGHLSALDTLDTHAEEDGDIEEGNSGMAEGRGSGHSGETTLRGEEGDAPMAQASSTR